MLLLRSALAAAVVCALLCAAAVVAAADADACPPYPEQLISYALGSGEHIKVDGKLDDAAWQAVGWSDEFVDISGSPPQPFPRFGTRVKTRWDDKFIYFGAYLQEPNVWANMTEHDSVIFNDNDFEVFIDPDGSTHHYKEFEINAINVFWDLELNKPYIDGGQANNTWDMLGVAQTATYAAGPVNDPNAGLDAYWTVELALPHAYYVQQCFAARSPPRDGDLWRINFSRVEYRVHVVDGEYQKVPGTSADNWVWQSQGTVNMHLPERWGYLQFSTAAVNTSRVERDPTWRQRAALAQTYDAEHEFEAVNGYYTADLTQLSTLPVWVTNGACGTAAPNVTFPGGEIYRFAASVLSTARPDLPVGNVEDDRLIWFGDVPPPDSTV